MALRLGSQRIFSFSQTSRSIHSTAHISNKTHEKLVIPQFLQFKILPLQYFSKAADLLAREFADREPLSNAYYRKFQNKTLHPFQDWRQYWTKSINQAVYPQFSIGVFDVSKNNQLIAASIGRDFDCEDSKATKDLSLQPLTAVSAINLLEKFLIQKVNAQLKTLFFTKGMIALLDGSAVKPEYSQKGIGRKIIQVQQRLAKSYKYKFTYGIATNKISMLIFTKLNYEMVGKINCREFEVGNIKPFQDVEDENSCTSIWIKKLDQI